MRYSCAVDYGRRIAEARKAASVTQDELAAKLEVASRVVVARWESGFYRPSPAHQLALRDLYGIEPDPPTSPKESTLRLAVLQTAGEDVDTAAAALHCEPAMVEKLRRLWV